MNKEEFIRSLAKKHRRPQKFYRNALGEILAGIQEHLKHGKDISFLGFGTFYTRQKQGGRSRNFKTGEPMEYQPVRQVAFRVGRVLKRAVRKDAAQQQSRQRKKGLFSLLKK
jgi:DNA-binding protein HU-beta